MAEDAVDRGDPQDALLILQDIPNNSRHSIGTGVIGGMLFATGLAIFFVPMFFIVLQKLGSKLSGGDGPAAAAPGAAGAPESSPEPPAS